MVDRYFIGPSVGSVHSLDNKRDLYLCKDIKNSLPVVIFAEPVRSRSHTPVKSRPLTPKSRPVTPARYSRPRTPNTVNGSRPDTPRTSSRPSTPAQLQRLGTPNENINKEENANGSPTRHGSKECVAEAAASDDDSDLKHAFNVKHREFITMKRDLDIKQVRIPVLCHAYDRSGTCNNLFCILIMKHACAEAVTI